MHQEHCIGRVGRRRIRNWCPSLTLAISEQAVDWQNEQPSWAGRQSWLVWLVQQSCYCNSTTVIDNFIHTCSTKHAAYIYPQTNMQYNDIIGYLMPNAELINLVHHHLILMWRCMDHLCPSMGETIVVATNFYAHTTNLQQSIHVATTHSSS